MTAAWTAVERLRAVLEELDRHGLYERLPVELRDAMDEVIEHDRDLNRTVKATLWSKVS